MATQKDNYAPRPLSTSIEYPDYQFYAELRFKGHTADECLLQMAAYSGQQGRNSRPVKAIIGGQQAA